MSKILFINPNLRFTGELMTVYPPLGILSIASVLRKNHYGVKVLDADIDNLSFQEIADYIHQYQPNFIGITMTTLQCKTVSALAEFIKIKFHDIIIIVGGVHPSALKGEILKHCSAIDIVVVGEGENTFLDLVKTIENGDSLEGVNGICYWKNNAICITESRSFIENLDDLPFPAFDLIEPLSKYPGATPVGARPSIHIMASRGCPFGCQFCSNPIWGKKVRFQSPEYILKEIEWLQKTFNVHEIFFQDDTFNLNRQWLEMICNGIISRGLNNDCIFKAPFRANSNLVSRDLLKLLKNAGFWMIFYGVESGDPEVLKSINKNITLEELKRAFYMTKRAGIKTYASFMIGNLADTPTTIKNSITFAKTLDPDYFGFAVTMPYPGSLLYKSLEENNQISLSDTMDLKKGRYIIPNVTFSQGEVEDSSKNATEDLQRTQNKWTYKLIHYLRYHYIPRPQKDYLDYIPFNQSHLHDPLNSYVELGVTDDNYLGNGWHMYEYWPPFIRWTKGSAVLFLHPKKTDTVLKIKIIASRPRGGQFLSILIDHDIYKISVDKINQGLITLPINPDLHMKKFCKIVITTIPLWIPNDEMNNGDLRKLGVAINKIWTE
jgi:anaerobic magnesium-protoporphyrin IX monomethyl ester cyclase